MVGMGAVRDSREVRKHLAGDAGRRRRLNERRLRSDDCHRIRAAATLNRPGSAGGSTTKASARVTRGVAECSKRVRSDLESGSGRKSSLHKTKARNALRVTGPPKNLPIAPPGLEPGLF